MENGKEFVFSSIHIVGFIQCCIAVVLYFIKRYLDKIDKRLDDMDNLEIKVLLNEQDLAFVKKECERNHYKTVKHD